MPRVKPKYKMKSSRKYVLMRIIISLLLLALALAALTAFLPGEAVNHTGSMVNNLLPESLGGRKIGDIVDSLDGVNVYYNGSVSNVSGRTTTADGYNIGQKYQCVEFIKRYYYEHFKHKMPNSYGHAKDFFNPALADGAFNKERGLYQYTNPGAEKPQKGDLIVFGKGTYGHVAIVASVNAASITIIQQNPGPHAPSRLEIPLFEIKDTSTHPTPRWQVKHSDISGWLHLKQN